MASITLLPEMTALREKLPSIVAGVESHAPYGAALLSARQGMRITVDNNEERIAEMPPAAGTVITAFDGATMREAAIGGFSLREVEKGARSLVEGVDFARHWDAQAGPVQRGDFVSAMEIPPDSLSTREKLDRVRQLHNRLRSIDQRIANVQVDYRERSELSVFCNRNSDLAQRVQRVTLFVLAFSAGDQGIRYDWAVKSGVGGWEKLEFTDEELQALVKSSIALQSAVRIEPGEYTIVTAPGVSGVIVHESFGHGVETDMFLKERARAASYIDQPVGSPLVNIIDDPSYPGVSGSYFFDDEGQLAGPTHIVEGGIFRRGITDFYSAAALGLKRSANGRRQDYSRKAYARMSNTFFVPGTTPVNEIFAQVDRGVYLEKWSSGMEDPQGWGIQVTCHYGREIVNGKATDKLYSPVGITGYVPDVLQSVTAVGNDLAMDGGGCGKGHKEYVSVSSGGPHLLMKARLG